MKQQICILTIVFGLFSCINKTSKKTTDQNKTETLQTILTKKSKSEIYIKDKSQYDQIFLDGLANYFEPIKLIDNYIITAQDTTYFPEDLKLNQVTTFKTTKGKHKYLLSVTRTNLTNLNYEFQLTGKDNNLVFNKSGKAILRSMFFLASEIDLDDETGDMYGSSEYWDESNQCMFGIRIGIGKDDNGKRRATVEYACNDKNKQTLKFHECPTLRTE